MRHIYQHHNNDCALACVSMVTGIYHGTLLNAAIARGFIPDNGIGLSVPSVLHWFGYSCAFSDRSHGLESCEPRIVIVDLGERYGPGIHALVVEAGKVYDPNNQNPMTLSDVGWLSIGMIYEIQKSPQP